MMEMRSLWWRLTYWQELDSLTCAERAHFLEGMGDDHIGPARLCREERTGLACWIAGRVYAIVAEKAWAPARRGEHVTKRIGLHLGSGVHRSQAIGEQAIRFAGVRLEDL